MVAASDAMMMRTSATKRVMVLMATLVLAGCKGKPAEPSAPSRTAPRPLQPLERVVSAADAGPGAEVEASSSVVPLPPVGPSVPPGAKRLVLDGEGATLDGQPVPPVLPPGPLLLAPTPETYLAQAAGWLARLDDAEAEVWLAHPEAGIAVRLELRDEVAFRAWLDEPVPGKVRVIHRQDGFEVMTNLGKLPGGDPNGPTVPVRGGQLDLTTLQRGLQRVRQRFPEAPDVCFVPSFGIELSQTARSLVVDFAASDAPIFPSVCLVYPRPAADAGRD